MKFIHYTNLFLMAATAITWLLSLLPNETGRYIGELNEGAVGLLAYYQATLGFGLAVKYYRNRLLQLYVLGVIVFFVIVLPMSMNLDFNYFPWHLPMALALLFTYILYTENKKRHEKQ